MGLSCTYCSGVDESTIPCYPFEIRRPPNISSLQGTSNQRSKCVHSHSMTPVTNVRAGQSVPSFINTQGIQHNLNLASAVRNVDRKYPCHKIPSTLVTSFEHAYIPRKACKETCFIRRRSVHDNHTIFSLSEWGTQGTSEMTCCICGGSSRTYIYFG